MICTNCNHRNEGGKFCENCGARLPVETAAAAEQAASMGHSQEEQGRPGPSYSGPSYTGASGAASGQPNVYLQNAKNASRSYFNYFGAILKRPFGVTQQVGRDQLIYAIITIVIFSVLAPLMVYFNLGSARKIMDSPFLNVVIKPTITLAVFIVLIATFSFVAIKLAKVQAGYQDVLSRFGAMLVPFLALLAVAFVLSILQLEIFAFFLAASFVGLMFIVPPMLIASWVKPGHQGGLDMIYGVLLTYVATIITIGIIGDAIERILLDATPFGMLRGF
ncbi:zinc ribbon domain-containing protein [Paenibacillus sp. J22TS3]|uniref:zinc ribbon domain-containing protein n=1 Tax=Paenibacillus sp. J22TS3 TaxID=2807192 RepID=UPI001AFD01E1|nr:zinc ribbon domain-containing protein [Paenibacillus sp. J22TS3]GIP22050.1 zinc ribbon domain-containing protein [Paenibacillus sp. J22TS3]